MKNRISILLLNLLLLASVSYVQIFQKPDSNFSTELTSGAADDAEETGDNTSKENARETDLDEDSIKPADAISLHNPSFPAGSKNGNYAFFQLGYFPEIVSPPPQV